MKAQWRVFRKPESLERESGESNGNHIRDWIRELWRIRMPESQPRSAKSESSTMEPRNQAVERSTGDPQKQTGLRTLSLWSAHPTIPTSWEESLSWLVSLWTTQIQSQELLREAKRKPKASLGRKWLVHLVLGSHCLVHSLGAESIGEWIDKWVSEWRTQCNICMLIRK